MNKFDKVGIFELKKADRFYFMSDSRKLKWEIEDIVENEKKEVQKVWIENGGKKREIKENKRVVYLRNAYDQ